MLGRGVSGIFIQTGLFLNIETERRRSGELSVGQKLPVKKIETDQYQDTSADNFGLAAQQCAETLPGAKTAKTEQKGDGSDNQRAGARFGGAVGGNGKTDGKGIYRGGDPLEEELGGAQTDSLHVAGVRTE